MDDRLTVFPGPHTVPLFWVLRFVLDMVYIVCMRIIDIVYVHGIIPVHCSQSQMSTSRQLHTVFVQYWDQVCYSKYEPSLLYTVGHLHLPPILVFSQVFPDRRIISEIFSVRR